MVVIENICDFFICSTIVVQNKISSLKKLMVNIYEEFVYFLYKMLIKMQPNSTSSYLLNSEDKERKNRHSYKNKLVFFYNLEFFSFILLKKTSIYVFLTTKNCFLFSNLMCGLTINNGNFYLSKLISL